MIKAMDLDLLENFLRRMENCGALLDELVASSSFNEKALAATADLLEKIGGDLSDEIDTANGFSELAGMLVPSIPAMMESGYSFDQAKFVRDFLTEADDKEQTGSLFAVVVPFIVQAYNCGREGKALESLYPFIKRT